MNVSHPRALLISLASGAAVSVAGGLLFAVFGDRGLLYAIGAIMLVVGLAAFALGLLGAAEPPDGWATGVGKNRRTLGQRRSFAAKMADQAGAEKSESLSLAVWGLVVGGGLIACGALIVSLA